MKKLLLLIAILFTVFGFSQPISVNTSNYTVPELVNNVLINSPCVTATNVTWRTGTNFGSTNGIGFFQNSNPNFPMHGGVILSTGNVTNAPGPNTSLLSDGSLTWEGDSNLEATLAAAGIPMISKNASVLEFDFTPLSPYFNFDFIFASEEYGNFQCHYSDAFAFLLTNMNTGVTTNLAVVPNSTDPISVVTIRDFLYNSSCPSANAEYFGSFNGGSAAANSATNFNGQTKVMSASSILTPNVPYHIKLVIADRIDPQSDSAIFIAADSFNIGQDVLGLDLTVDNHNAVCFGSSQLLDTGLDASQYTFVWKKNNTVLNGEDNSSLLVTTPGVYSVTYYNQNTNCVPITDTITVEYYPQITSPNPNPLIKCNNGAASYDFNLDYNTAIVKNGLDPLTSVTYFASAADAEGNTNALPLLYNSVGNQTIYVRIQLPNQCFVLKSFELQVTGGPIANQPQDMVKCAKSITNLTATFNLNTQKSSILNGQPTALNTVTFYTSLLNATTGTNPITNPSGVTFPDGTVIYVRVENASDPTCYSLTSFNLIVNPVPEVDVLLDVLVCTSYILPPLVNGNYFTGPGGTGIPLFAGSEIIQTTTIYIYNQPDGPGTCASGSHFKVIVVDPDSLTPQNVNHCGSYKLPVLTYGNYYTAPHAGGTEIPAGTYITSNQTVYYYFVTPEPPFCEVDSSFEVVISPTVEVGQRPDVFDCTSYTLPTLTIGKYYTGPNGSGTQLFAGAVITTSQTIYVYEAATNTSFCSDQDKFDVVIGLNQLSDISQCNSYFLPELSIGNYYTQPMGQGDMLPAGTEISESKIIYIYVPSTNEGVNCTNDIHFSVTIAQPVVDIISDQSVCVSYTLPNITNGTYHTGPNGTGNILSPGTIIEETQTLYIFKQNGESDCFNQSSFTVTVNSLPNIDSRSDIDICDQYILTPLSVGNYFTGPNGTGTMLTAGSAITNSQQIFIYAISNTTPACSIENSFQINIFSTSAEAPADVTACDTYTLPALPPNNHYYTMTGGPYGSGTEIAPGTVFTNSQSIYVFKESLIRTSFSCVNEKLFTITINHTPVLPAFTIINSCSSYELLPLPVGNYYTGPNGSGTMLHAGDLITSSQTLYIYAHTATAPDCSSEVSFFVTIFNVDNLPNVTTCESYTLPALSVGHYFTGVNGTGNQLAAGSIITSTQTVYVYGVAPFLPRCSDESSFVVTIIDTPVAHAIPVGNRTLCDEDGTNDGVTSFNLSSLNSAVLGNQTGTQFTIAYYSSLVDAANQTNALTATTATLVYVRVSNTLAPNCYDIQPITLIVNKLPVPTPIDGIICIESETGELLNPYTMYSGLASSTHSFVWTNANGETVGTQSSYQAILPGTYTLIATNNATGCESAPVAVNVIPSEPALVSYTISEDFSSNQNVTVEATGQGNNFEYQLDNGPFQDNPVFENVTSGIHTITVRDKYGCGSTTVQALVVNYPKFFTPNGDGINDTWNIRDLAAQHDAIITIFDRFGKIIKIIKPSNTGWDGTYNGSLMPSDDYWFSVSYHNEKQEGKEFKAHFAMKR